MPPTLKHRDLLLCVVARRREAIDDAALEGVVARWLAKPEQPLAERLFAAAKLSPADRSRLEDEVDRQANDTCVDPQNARLRLLPAGVQRLLGASDVQLATDQPLDTRRDDAPRSGVRPAAPQNHTPGERFDVQQVLAQGGLGVVFLARDQEIDRTVALKQIKSQWADDDDSRVRFLLEARITGRLEHPGIVPIYALGADATGRPYYAMRLIRGESLLEVLERFHDERAAKATPHQRTSELRKLLQRFIDVCNAVDYAHSKGVIHRDLKPSNIMVGKYGETLVVDWGLAKVIGSDEDVALTTRMIRTPESEGGGTSTRIGTTIGTPAYMSPEQAAGRNDELTPACDVYCLGATLYHLLTGWLPHAADDDVGVMIARAENCAVVPPRERAPWLPRPLESICLKALAARPEQRYISARALSDDIERWLGDEPVRAHADSWSERTYRWMRNHRTLATSLAVAYVVAAAAIVAGVVLWNYRDTHRRDAEQSPPGVNQVESH
jgi:serine/threonine protein kinase